MKRPVKLSIALSIVVVLLYTLLVLVGHPKLEQSMNKVVPHAPYKIPADIQSLHRGLTIADLHCDSTLWARDLTVENHFGHVDIPRLIQGNVALQVFTAVTKSPRGQNYESNTDSFDNITLLAVAQLWPVSTWTSLSARAIYQAEKLHDTADRVPDRFRVVKTAADLEQVLKERERARKSGAVGPVAGLLGIEGLHALEGRFDNIAGFYDAGYRLMGLHHFFDNETGGSLHGVSGAGLTQFGREVVRELDRRSVIIDLAHSSPRAVEEILELSNRPQIISHTGCAGHFKSPRNISDNLMKRIAAKGGLIGVGYWRAAVGDITPKGVAGAIAYAVDLVGEDHVSLGSDFDGAVTTMFDTSELAVLTRELKALGFSEERISRVMGGNTIRFLLANLPRQ